jgi:membrane fusion protein, macrolide-specific efflux system
MERVPAEMETKTISPTPEPLAAVDDEPAAPARGRHFKFLAPLRWRGLWVIGLLAVAGAGAFGYHLAFGKAKIVYSTAAVERGDVESTVVAAGILQPVLYVDVGAQTSGKLKSLKVKRGDMVEQDQLLAEIDPVLADSALTAANATLENMTSQRAVKQAQLALATAQRARNEALFAEQIISANDRDIARANYEVASADVASLSAQIKQATAAVGTANANRGYTNITAPMAGEVVSISTLEGQTLNANQQAPNILRIADMSTVTVWAQVSEADIVRVKLGQDVYFTVLGQTRRWSGKIRQILPTPELISGVVFYDVLVDMPNADRELKIQMTAQVFIVLARVKGVLLIPAAAVGSAGEGAKITVQVLKPDGTTEPRAITIGIKSELSAEITAGLKEGEEVVIREITAKGDTKSALTARKGR